MKKNYEKLNPQFTNDSSIICNFLDDNNIFIILLFSTIFFLSPSIVNNVFSNKFKKTEVVNNSLNLNESFISNFDVEIEKLNLSDFNNVRFFIFKYFLEGILTLSQESINKNYSNIINNENFFHFIKHIFSNKSFVNDSLKDIRSRDLFILKNFFNELQKCDNIESFNLITKNTKVIHHTINYLKKIYKIE